MPLSVVVIAVKDGCINTFAVFHGHRWLCTFLDHVDAHATSNMCHCGGAPFAKLCPLHSTSKPDPEQQVKIWDVPVLTAHHISSLEWSVACCELAT